MLELSAVPAQDWVQQTLAQTSARPAWPGRLAVYVMPAHMPCSRWYCVACVLLLYKQAILARMTRTRHEERNQHGLCSTCYKCYAMCYFTLMPDVAAFMNQTEPHQLQKDCCLMLFASQEDVNEGPSNLDITACTHERRRSFSPV